MTTRMIKLFSVTMLTFVIALSAGCGDKPAADNSNANPAMAKLVAEYPLTTCVVTGKKLGDMGKPHDVLYEGKLVRFCCSSCVKEFNTNPAEYIAKIDAASKPR